MYKQLFDTGVDRRGTNCLKWDSMRDMYGSDELLPLWVADMDFRAPDCVKQALQKLIDHNAYGYALDDPDEKQAVIDWMRERHNTDITPDMIAASPCVVDSLNLLVGAYAKPGAKVAVQTPVYGPFFGAITRAGCEIYDNPLIETCEGWKMDLEGLERGFKQGVKLMLLCNPHNPVGRVYTLDELKALCALADKYGVTIISDEIHADFEMPGHKHICLLTLTRNAVALISASKTFNLAALKYSSILFGAPSLKTAAMDYWQRLGVGGGNLFGAAAQTAAYRHGGEWLNALLDYIYENYKYARARIESELPAARVSDMQGMYLMWIDMRAFGMKGDELKAFITQKARLALTNGEFFGERGAGYIRVNLAAPRATITRAMDRLISAFAALGK